ncbi:MAG: tryptophan synthase subunit alpha [Deltaproteobacteria bacterium]|nr:tryptophan synthase subunit alpha [Deltaproteobacteria bacterium]
MLEESIRQQRQSKPILLMTHLVLGFPSFEENMKAIDAMSDAGVELVELQIPFTEPVADGPVILKANSDSIKNGTKVKECFAFASEVAQKFPGIQFLLMTYYNIVFTNGQGDFISKAKKSGVKGFIIPDLPPEEGESWLKDCEDHRLENIFIFTPMNTSERLKAIASYAKGFVYCVGRRGVTGSKTSFDENIAKQISRYRSVTRLPLAVGFGVREKADVEFLRDKADIAVIGSKLIDLQINEGTSAIRDFLRTLR